MFRSLHMKLTLILLLLITSLMAVVGAFLTISVSGFFTDTFYEQINSVLVRISWNLFPRSGGKRPRPTARSASGTCWT